MRHAISSLPGRVLLLGVTPELAVLGRELVAVDNSPAMLEHVWPGDTDSRRAVLADWADLPFNDSEFDAVIGDGSLNSAPEQVEQVLGEAKRVLSTTGRAVFRLFCSPEEPEPLQSIQEDVLGGWTGNVHALKWRIAMSLASQRPRSTVPVEAILQAFDEMFPDRTKLAACTGWSLDEIATLDAYRGADHSLGFPTLSELLDRAAPYFSSAVVKHGSGYPLAHRCPTIVFEGH